MDDYMRKLAKNTNLSMISFTAAGAASFIGVDKRSIFTWIKRGKLSAKQNTKFDDWVVTGRDLVEFLHANPKYMHYLEDQDLKGFPAVRKDTVLAAIYRKKPRLYNVDDICRILHVAPETVRDWANNKGLKTVKNKHAISKHLYKLSDLREFLANNETYQKRLPKEGEEWYARTPEFLR